MVGVWSITVFDSDTMITKRPDGKKLRNVSLKASDITDVPAEFVADPFIIYSKSILYMFFEIMDKSSGKGVIGLATSKDNGASWNYDRAVLRENYHLSYPYVFKNNGEFFMIPESSEAGKVLLYKAREFPYKWEVVSELIQGKFVDSSIFYYKNKWWLFACKSGNLHLFFSEKLEGKWEEHPESPLISNDYSVTRPGGRVIVEGGHIYRYAQDGEPHYGSALRVFQITELSVTEYEEKEVNLVLSGSNRKKDWNENGMHSIDQCKLSEGQWIVTVDGHRLVPKSHLFWKLDRLIARFVYPA